MSLITFLTRIHFADHVVDDVLPEAVGRLSAARIFLIVDRDGEAGDAIARVEDALPTGCAVTRFSDIQPSAVGLALHRARRIYEAAGCELIIALGGATALDCGRLLASLGRHGEARPLVAIPTTAAGVGLGPIYDHDPGHGSRAVIPTAVLCDPTMTVAIDPARTAAHGFDALAQCVEAFLATAYNPPADGIALEGIHRSVRFLERAVADGNDLEARRELLAVALNAGLAAQKGLGGLEALARATEVECGLAESPGKLHAAFVQPVLAFNAPAVGDRFARVAHAMGLAVDADVPAALAALGARLGLPDRIGAIWTDRERLRHVARKAAADPANQTNPRHATPDDYMSLLAQAL